MNLSPNAIRKSLTQWLKAHRDVSNRRWRRRAFKIGLVLAVFYLIYLFCAGDYGLFRIRRLVRQRDDLNREYLALVAEAVDCSDRLRRIESDPHFVEWLARTRFGYSRSDDIIYHLNYPSP